MEWGRRPQESGAGERLHPDGAGTPFANESLPVRSQTMDETDYANQAMASTAGNAAILIGLFSLPFSRITGWGTIPALIGVLLACWCLAASHRKRRGVLGSVICLVALALAGQLLYEDVSAWYVENFEYNQF